MISYTNSTFILSIKISIKGHAVRGVARQMVSYGGRGQVVKKAEGEGAKNIVQKLPVKNQIDIYRDANRW